MDKDEFNCDYCDTDFKIAHDHLQDVAFCPFCGTELEHEDVNDDSEKDWE
jgi:uncharacterized Zn-finger protein